MAEIRLEKLTKHFGDVKAVEDLDLEMAHGAFVALLGPSGCGKTTTMNMIAGLEVPTSGEIYFDAYSMRGVEPGDRSVGFVFQNYAIFTHMNVYDNIAFGLRAMDKKSRPSEVDVDRKVRDVAETVGVTNLLDARARRLSVNDMQKVALGRSMIVEPAIFLLDEPFSNLDAAFRAYMRAELKRIQHEMGQTMVYVTHDQVEAMGMADKIAVMNLGELQQYGSPDEIYNRPANRFVANFVGSVLNNFFSGRYEEVNGRAEVLAHAAESQPVDVTNRRTKIAERVNAGGTLTMSVRPERFRLVDSSAEDATLKGKISLVEALGSKNVAHLKVDGNDMRVVLDANTRPKIGENVGLAVNADDVHLFDDSSGLALR